MQVPQQQTRPASRSGGNGLSPEKGAHVPIGDSRPCAGPMGHVSLRKGEPPVSLTSHWEPQCRLVESWGTHRTGHRPQPHASAPKPRRVWPRPAWHKVQMLLLGAVTPCGKFRNRKDRVHRAARAARPHKRHFLRVTHRPSAPGSLLSSDRRPQPYAPLDRPFMLRIQRLALFLVSVLSPLLPVVRLL